ncbi:MAG: TonB-dependent receptor [Myxococcales bacterium]|nr:TonB-dependent receptor [Myxococcales bacterium]
MSKLSSYTVWLQSCTFYILLTYAPGISHATKDQAISASQLADYSLEDLLEMEVVTASGVAEDRRSAAANIHVVSASDIKEQGWRSLAEILQSVPGLYIVDDHVFPAINVRGISAGYKGGTRIVKVMIDGQAINFRPDLTAFIGPEYIPIETIDRIEIAKGPLSALYGANAFLATVNVITREGSQNIRRISASTNWRDDRASFDASAVIEAGDQQKNIMFALTAGRFDRSGLKLENTSGIDTVLENIDEKNIDDLSQPLSLFYKLQLSKPDEFGEITLEGGYQRLQVGSEFQLNSLLSHRSLLSLENYWSAIKYQYHFGTLLDIQARLVYQKGNPQDSSQQYLTNDLSKYYYPNYEYHSGLAQLELNINAGDVLRITAGADAEIAVENVLYLTEVLNRPVGEREAFSEIDIFDTNSDRKQNFTGIGVYSQLKLYQLDQLPSLSATANIRLDYIRWGDIAFPTTLSWRGAISYEWSDALVTKLISGQAFQVPSGTLLFSQGGFGNIFNVIGSEQFPELGSLRPQTIFSVETWTSFNPLDWLAIELGVYYQELDDAIEFVLNGPFVVATNRGSRSFIGGEMSAHLKLSFLDVQSSVNVVFPRNSLETSLLDDTDITLESYPEVYSSTRLKIDFWSQGYGILRWRWVGERGSSQNNAYLNRLRYYKLDPYSIFDVLLTPKSFSFISDYSQTQVSIGILNLTNEKYHEPGFGGVDIPQLGRRFILTIHQSL